MAEQSKNSCRQPIEVKGEGSLVVFVHLSLTNQAPFTHKEIIWITPRHPAQTDRSQTPVAL